jgi:hypothetical protein
MTKRARILRSTALGAAAAVALLLLSATPALAANGIKPAGKGNNPSSSHGGSSTPTGNDISYPQCGGSLPSGQAFGIVGVNGGLANNANPCLGPDAAVGGGNATSELYWAQATSLGATSQPNASLYVNTADPGNMYKGKPVKDWPRSSISSDPYTACTTTYVLGSNSITYQVGENSPGCAWQYGYTMAVQDGQLLVNAANAVDNVSSTTCSLATVSPVPCSPSSYPWWLDIETANSWQSLSTTYGQDMNVADIQGILAGLGYAGATFIGVYSTSYQWVQIVGSPNREQVVSGTFLTLPDWIPGARNLPGAESNCCEISSKPAGLAAYIESRRQ